MRNKDNKIFSSRLIRLKEKSKYLLKPFYYRLVLKDIIKITNNLKRNPNIYKIWIGGSLVKKQLGKYVKKWNERLYSDIDLFILVKDKGTLSELGLVKKIYKLSKNGRVIRYYRISLRDKEGKPLRIMNRFSVDVWLMTPNSYKKDLKRFPSLLNGAIEVK